MPRISWTKFFISIQTLRLPFPHSFPQTLFLEREFCLCDSSSVCQCTCALSPCSHCIQHLILQSLFTQSIDKTTSCPWEWSNKRSLGHIKLQEPFCRLTCSSSSLKLCLNCPTIFLLVFLCFCLLHLWSNCRSDENLQQVMKLKLFSCFVFWCYTSSCHLIPWAAVY